ncbi:Fur-regulated basic protein FbpA [Peribacillus sp. NPDC097197]|uniref:Fur-regulated basic protein FbpA n=1 Tax=unclassified Peribacillus TaxID=2675266 RepID=UPI003816FB0E
MGDTIRKGMEERRKKLINKLCIAYQDESMEQLLKLSLTELENMHSKLLLEYHPHNDVGSLRWSKKK